MDVSQIAEVLEQILENQLALLRAEFGINSQDVVRTEALLERL